MCLKWHTFCCFNRRTKTSMNNPYLLFVLAMLLFSSCGPSFREQNEKIMKVKKADLQKDSMAFKVAVTPTLDCLPIYVAKESGIFDSIGVDVSLKMKNSLMECDEIMRKGQVECMNSDLMRTERLKRQGIPLSYITATNAYWQMIGNKKGRIKEIGNLGDKMIAISRYSATDYLATLAIDSIKPKKPVFRIQVNDVFVRLMMLVNNEMDAVMLTEPQATTARLNNNVVMMDSRQKDIQLGVIAIHTSRTKDTRRKNQLKKFEQAYNMAVDSINDKGMDHYSAVIMKYCKTDLATIKALPKLEYGHTSTPRTKDINRTANVKWRTN